MRFAAEADTDMEEGVLLLPVPLLPWAVAGVVVMVREGAGVAFAAETREAFFSALFLADTEGVVAAVFLPTLAGTTAGFVAVPGAFLALPTTIEGLVAVRAIAGFFRSVLAGATAAAAGVCLRFRALRWVAGVPLMEGALDLGPLRTDAETVAGVRAELAAALRAVPGVCACEQSETEGRKGEKIGSTLDTTMLSLA